MLRDKDGHWNVPNVNWNGDEFNRNANWLDNDWNGNERVVLLATQKMFFRLLFFRRFSFLCLAFPAIKHTADFFGFKRKGEKFFLVYAV